MTSTVSHIVVEEFWLILQHFTQIDIWTLTEML